MHETMSDAGLDEWLDEALTDLSALRSEDRSWPIPWSASIPPTFPQPQGAPHEPRSCP